MIINIALGLITVLLTALTWLTDIRGQDKSKKNYGILSIVLILIAAILSIIKDRDASNKIEIANQTINFLNEKIIHLEQAMPDPENLSGMIQGKWKTDGGEQWDFLSDGTLMINYDPTDYKLLDDGRLKINFGLAQGVFDVSFTEDIMMLIDSNGKFNFRLHKVK